VEEKRRPTAVGPCRSLEEAAEEAPRPPRPTIAFSLVRPSWAGAHPWGMKVAAAGSPAESTGQTSKSPAVAGLIRGG
jgi:hypothetical protein